MNLYVMRHGTTVWNEKGITQGRSKNRLSKSGIELVKSMAIEYRNVKFDAIICSPLVRTIQTANLMNVYHNVKIYKDELLIEIDQVQFTGRDFRTLTKEEIALKKSRSKKAGMESYDECLQRVKEFVYTIKNKYNFKNILVITHNCVATFIEDIITNKKIDFSDRSCIVNFNNAEIKKFLV